MRPFLPAALAAALLTGCATPRKLPPFEKPLAPAPVHATCGIGSGITSGAGAAAEWAEWRHKRAFVERASAPFDILETLGLHDGKFHHADLHLRRMGEAAAHFGYPFNAHAVRQELQIAALQHRDGHWRVRLLLAADGSSRAQAFEMHATAEPVRLALATRPLEEAHSEFVRYKTTRRAHYAALAPTAPGVFDTASPAARAAPTSM